MFYKRIVLLFFTLGLLLSGCNSPLYNQTEGNAADVKQRVNQAIQKSNDAAKPEPSLIVNSGFYVDKTPVSLAKQPRWLKNHIILRGDQLPFSYYSRTIVGGSGVNVLTHYQTGLEESVAVSMNYSGTVQGALDLLAAKTGYVYSVNGNDIYWQAFITKTFDIAFMPGASDYMMGKTSGGGTSNTAASNATAGGGQTTSAIIDDSASSQYSNFKGSLSVWKDLTETIRQLLSPQGKVIVSESTTSVTVRDRPTNVALVSKYIQNINNNLSKQVLVKVQILDVQLSSDFNFGVNWVAVKRALGSNFVLEGNYSNPVSIKPLVTTSLVSPLSGTTTLPQMGIQNRTQATGVTALISALSQQGTVSVVTEPRVVCLNNQVSVIRILDQSGYLASVQNTTSGASSSSGGASSNFVTSQITPGSVVSGLTLYVLPKILNNNVYLQVNADLSTLISIDPISSQTGGTPPTGAAAGSTIQVPHVTQKQFNQRSVIASGETLILSGFKQVSNKTGAMQLFNSQELGGKGAAQGNTETIILITPIILHGYA